MENCNCEHIHCDMEFNKCVHMHQCDPVTCDTNCECDIQMEACTESFCTAGSSVWTLIKKIKCLFTKQTNELKEHINSKTNEVKSHVTNKADEIKSHVTTKASEINSNTNSRATEIKSQFSTWVSSKWDAFSSAWTSFLSDFSSFKDNTGESLSSVSDKADKVLEQIGNDNYEAGGISLYEIIATMFSNYAKKTDLPTDYAKQETVTGWINGAWATFVTWIETKVELLAHKTDIPSVASIQSGLAKTSELPTDYAKKIYIDAIARGFFAKFKDNDPNTYCNRIKVRFWSKYHFYDYAGLVVTYKEDGTFVKAVQWFHAPTGNTAPIGENQDLILYSTAYAQEGQEHEGEDINALYFDPFLTKRAKLGSDNIDIIERQNVYVATTDDIATLAKAGATAKTLDDISIDTSKLAKEQMLKELFLSWLNLTHRGEDKFPSYIKLSDGLRYDFVGVDGNFYRFACPYEMRLDYVYAGVQGQFVIGNHVYTKNEETGSFTVDQRTITETKIEKIAMASDLAGLAKQGTNADATNTAILADTAVIKDLLTLADGEVTSELESLT